MRQTHPVFNSVKILYSTFISLMHSSLCASIPLALLHPSSSSVLHIPFCFKATSLVWFLSWLVLNSVFHHKFCYSQMQLMIIT